MPWSQRVSRNAVTMGAASLVLTFSPALVAPSSATSPTPPPAKYGSPSSSQVQAASVAFRTRIRAAVVERDAAVRRANVTLSAALEPHRSALTDTLSQATTRAERRNARQVFGEASLAPKLAHRAAVDAAHLAFIDACEQARVDFLRARGAAADTVAHAAFRQALTHATAEYRVAVNRARDAHRIDLAHARSNPAHSERGSDRTGASSTGAAASPGPAALDTLAQQDAAGVFRTRLSSAKYSYQSKIANAKKVLAIELS